jgi:hypothetical protein
MGKRRGMVTHLPVLVIAFNRPDHLARILTLISEYGARNIFVFVDGPAAGMTEQSIREVESTQQIAQAFKTKFGANLLASQFNLGCYSGVKSAVDWFFNFNEYGLILEDDLEIHPDTFAYMEDALNRYRNNSQVGSISGYRTQFERGINQELFSRYPSSWGWATWKNRWDLFDPDAHREIQKKYPMLLGRGGIRGLRRWIAVAKRLQNGELDSWAYRWMFTFWLRGWQTVVPPINLIKNLGFEERATHTKSGFSSELSVVGIAESKPNQVVQNKPNRAYDHEVLFKQFGIKSRFSVNFT